MARKRGGLAGLWDRNKGVIKTLAPIAAGVVGGPWAGAALGAAMRGLDRPGKSGIGFDVGEGIKGGIAGYGQGAMGRSIGSGVKGLLTAGRGTSGAAAPAAAKTATASAASPASSAITGGDTYGRMAQGANQYLAQGGTNASVGRQLMEQAGGSGLRDLFTLPGAGGGARNFLMSKEGLAAAGQFAGAGANIIGSQRQAALEEERLRREEEQARARAEMMAMFAPSILESFNTMPRGR